MINIFKKNKTPKSSDPSQTRVAEEPTFSRFAARKDDRQSVESSDAVPLGARLTSIDPALMEPVVSGAHTVKTARGSSFYKLNSAPDSEWPDSESPSFRSTNGGGAKPNETDAAGVSRRSNEISQQGAKTVPVPVVRTESGDALPQFKTPPLIPLARPERPSDPLDSGSQAKLWEAFTPTKPKRWSRYFAGRRWAIQRVITAIEEEQAHVVIFGARGIGKTSLANVLAESASQVEYQVLRCPCSADITFEEIFRGFLRNLPSEFMDRSARAKNPAVEHFEQLLPRGSFGPSELTVALSYLKLEHVILIVDEFDRVTSDHLKNQLAETIKNLSDISARITFIVVGIAQNLDEIIGKHPSIQRHLVAVHLPLMEPAELRALIEVGEAASGMHFDDVTRESVVSFAKGLPYYAQLMCLYSGRHALERESSSVEMRDLREAMAQVLDEADPVTAAMYDMATQGERNQFMTDVMFAAARCRFDRFGAFTAADAADVALDADERKLRELTLHKALSTLTLPQNGAVLEKRRTPSGTTKYSFQHQTMRQYILVRQARQRGLI